MNKKIIKLIIYSMLSVLALASLIFYILNERNENAKINPSIFPAFKKIKYDCLTYVDNPLVEPLKYENCKIINEADYNNYKYDNFVSAETWYQFISRLGFELPPLKINQPTTQEEITNAREELGRLKVEAEEAENNYFDNLNAEISN